MQIVKTEVFVLTLTRAEMEALRKAVNMHYPDQNKEEDLTADLYEGLTKALET